MDTAAWDAVVVLVVVNEGVEGLLEVALHLADGTL